MCLQPPSPSQAALKSFDCIQTLLAHCMPSKKGALPCRPKVALIYALHGSLLQQAP